MLLFILNNTIIICTIINFNIKISDLTVMQITTHGIYIQAIEANNNIMISSYINTKSVLNFLVKRNIQLQINTFKLQNICLHCNSKQIMEFYYFENNDTITIKLIENVKTTWLELTVESIEMPFLLMNHLQYDYNFQFNKQDIIHLCSTFLKINKNIIVKIVNECLHFITHHTLFTGEISFRNHALMPFNSNNYFKKEFNSKYWIILKDVLIMTNNIILSFNKNNPAKIHVSHTFGTTQIFILSTDLYN